MDRIDHLEARLAIAEQTIDELLTHLGNYTGPNNVPIFDQVPNIQLMSSNHTILLNSASGIPIKDAHSCVFEWQQYHDHTQALTDLLTQKVEN